MTRLWKRMKISSLCLCAVLAVASTVLAGINPAVVSFSGESWATEAQNGRKIVRCTGGFYHVVYKAFTGMQPTVEYSFSLDPQGVNWSVPAVVPGAMPGFCPALAIDQNDLLHLVWSDNLEIWYSNAPAGTNAWSPPMIVSMMPQTQSTWPSIDCDSNNAIHVAWQEVNFTNGIDDEIVYASSNNGGLTFSAPVQVSMKIPPTSGESERPCIACPVNWAPGSVHIVWDEVQKNPLTPFLVYHSADSGMGWTAPVLVSQIVPGQPDTEGLGPCLVVDAADNPHVVYSHWNLAAMKGVFYNQGANMGGFWSFGSAVMVSPTVNTFDVPNPTLSMDPDGVLRCIWHDDTLPGLNTRTLYYSYLEPGWGQWTMPMSFNTADYNCASLVYKNQFNRGGYACWTDGQIAPTNIQAAACPPVTIKLSGTPTSAKPGQTISWFASADNWTNVWQKTGVWIEAVLPNGKIFVKPFGNYNLPPGFSGGANMSIKIPATAPTGSYMISVVVGKLNVEDWDRDTFQLTVTRG